MRDHATVSPLFWIGETGKLLRKNPDAQRLAFYLITCPSSNMIGLYYLPIPIICHELGITQQGASKALRCLSEGGFCGYDEVSETVFVYNMAKFQVGAALKQKDKRVKGVEKMVTAYRNSPFCKQFIEIYGEKFNLFLDSPFQAPSKPLRSQEQEQEQEQDKKEYTAFATASDNNAVGEKGELHAPAGAEQSKTDFYRTKKGKKLQGKRLAEFERFWLAFDLKKDKAAAADSWLQIDGYCSDLVEAIVKAAEVEARARPGLIENGLTPKWAQGWLTARRWEDEDACHSGNRCNRCQYNQGEPCANLSKPGFDPGACGAFVAATVVA